jgi:hypothetical protein
VVFVCGGDAYTVRDQIDSAFFRGELEVPWKELLRAISAESNAGDLEIDDEALDAASQRFRYDHDLITAEETERWLEARGLTLGDFSDYFVRHYWANALRGKVEAEPVDYISAPEELRELLTAELLFSDELDRMAARLSWRVASNVTAENEELNPQWIAAERDCFFRRFGLEPDELSTWLDALGRNGEWFDGMLAMESRYRHRCEALLIAQAREREMNSLRLPLTRLDLEILEVDSHDAACEALFCVRDDGLSMEEVGEEERYPYRRVEVLLEDIPEETQQKFLSVSAGTVLEPIARGDGFEVCRVLGKTEPSLDDPAVRLRVERRILDRHFEELAANRIGWKTASLTS